MSDTGAGETDGAAGPRAAAPEGGARLRGAGVEVDGRRIGRLLLAAAVVGLALGAVVLGAATAKKNSELTALHAHGVEVAVTVTSCLGLAGGSGSNLAGYACDGRFELGGRTYEVSIPGSSFHRVHSRLTAVVDRGDPHLVSTPALLRNEHASAGAYLLPALLLLAAVAGGISLVAWWKRSARSATRA